MNKSRIALAYPDLVGNEEKYVVEAIRSSWISSTGKFVNRFEQEFAEFTQAKYALVVSNGTVALHLALLGLDVGPGDEILVPSLTYVATANAVRYVGAKPVFVDVDPETWCIDPSELEAKITPRTKAIIAVHLYGHPAEMDTINAIAANHGLTVIEDAAEAHGAEYKGRKVGGLGHVATFSFYGNKILTSGEGGALTLNDPNLYERLKMLRGQGMDPKRQYYFPIIGYNYRLTNVACALLCAQLERYNEIIQRRRRIVSQYQRQLSTTPGIAFQPVADNVIPAPWLFSVTIDEQVFGASREQVMQELAAKEIETRPFFVPLHTLPPHRSSEGNDPRLPVTDHLAARGMNLPTFPGMTDQEITLVCDALISVRERRCGSIGDFAAIS
jgi:perosamine synthetase